MNANDPALGAAEKYEDAEFLPAPRAGRIMLITWVVLAIILCVTILDVVLFVPKTPDGGGALALAMLAAVAGIMIVAWFCSRITSLEISGQQLSIKMTFWSARYDLAGLRSIEPDADVFKGVMRSFGNGGWGAFHGWFRGKRAGKFRAYVTDTDRSVVLRWGTRCVVVSPRDTDYFIEEVCKRTGVRRQN
ncbi:PH domain-containing protein [Ereboglobus luteus]|uniref:Bacterial Pleckstrin homology domain-containing protein n=1 Tax=Ereboglobus luteus TaxID=1796921 RepID=A0A2U8DZY9_9BACT|nr:PH domain-containing protein [Ereboglobus luteus]AWI08014.1 hypothetical protein CKA38_00915 [Ereboglobus luteus]